MYSTVYTGGLHGMESYLARVEVDASRGLPGFEMVGLLGSEVKEARERIRVALKNAEAALPPVRITVNISPASLHKEGTSYDLPVAVGILVSTGMIPQEYVKDSMIAGELGLSGEIKPVRGILPMALEAKRQGLKRCIVPMENLAEARLVEGIKILGADCLIQLIELLQCRESALEIPTYTDKVYMEKAGNIIGAGSIPGNAADSGNMTKPAETVPDFADVSGQEGAKRAAVVAAAGFHHLLMIGPPGSGKTMLARCIPSILPPLSPRERLEVTKVRSVAGLMEEGAGLLENRPFISPHHTVTSRALTGGGQVPRPGLISLAHRGVLFLDELTEFKRATLDMLRQPMEEHRVQIARSSGTYIYPSDFMLVAAMNPCPCGYFPDRNRCRCTPGEVQRYLNRVSGPILDRMDIFTEVSRIDFAGLAGENTGTGTDSRGMRMQVMEARARQEARYAGTRLRFNSQLGPGEIRRYCRLGLAQQQYMEQLFHALQLSARAYHRIIRLARTLADLDGKDAIEQVHLSEAACYRMADGKYWRKKG